MMPRDQVILACEVCGRRNYTTSKNKTTHRERVAFKKHCRWCGKHTLHKETR